MIAKSCISTSNDPYRAGLEIGHQLKTIDPEVVFLFSTIHYEGSPELLDGVFDALGHDIILIGNTGDGFFEKHEACEIGISALGIHSGGTVQWHLAYESGIKADPTGGANRCMKKINAHCKTTPAFCYVASDFRTDASVLVDALGQHQMGPIAGGMAGDDLSFNRCFVYANRAVLTDSLVVLAADGPLSVDIHVTKTPNEIGTPGVVTDCDGTLLRSIDHIPTRQFIEDQVGQPLTPADQGIFTLKLYQPENPEFYQIRSLFLDPDHPDALRLFGSVKEGDTAQFCMAGAENILHEIETTGGALSRLSSAPFAALLVSCAGRKMNLLDSLHQEPKTVLKHCPSLQALAGFPSFGEIGSTGSGANFQPPRFHNMVLVTLLIGDAS